jgi:hypothetical protein
MHALGFALVAPSRRTLVSCGSRPRLSDAFVLWHSSRTYMCQLVYFLWPETEPAILIRGPNKYDHIFLVC